MKASSQIQPSCHARSRPSAAASAVAQAAARRSRSASIAAPGVARSGAPILGGLRAVRREVVRRERGILVELAAALVDPLVARLADLPAARDLLVPVVVERGAGREELRLEDPHLVGEVPDAGRVGLREDLDLRMVSVVVADRAPAEGLRDRVDVLVAGLQLP